MPVTPGRRSVSVYFELSPAEHERLKEYAGLLTTSGRVSHYIKRAVLQQMERDQEVAARVRRTLAGEIEPQERTS